MAERIRDVRTERQALLRAAMTGADAEIAALRADVARLTQERDEALDFRDRAEGELGEMYWHLTTGKLSKPYTFADVKAHIEDAITEQVNEAVQQAEAERDALRAELATAMGQNERYRRALSAAKANIGTVAITGSRAKAETARARIDAALAPEQEAG